MRSVLTRPEDVRAVFKDSDQHVKATNNDAGWLMGEVLGNCVGLISGSKWRKLRLVTEKPFLYNCTTTYLSRIEHHIGKHFAYLHVRGRLSQGLIHPVADLKLLPFWIIADLIYGHLSPATEAQLRTLIPLREKLFQHVIAGGLSRFSASQYLPTAANRGLSKFKMGWASFNREALHESLADKRHTPLVQMHGAVESGTISLEELYQTLDEILFANLDVTAGALSWNLLFLGKCQASQADLRAEIITQKGCSKGDGNDWKGYLLSSSTLLAASILESARLKPLAAFSVPQATPTDRLIGDFLVPAGTNFVIDAYALNIRNPYWGDCPTDYKPERFMRRSATETRYHYWRFGFGPRTCMGKYVADLILKMIIAHVIGNYRLDLVGDRNDWDIDKDTWITHPKSDVLCEKISPTAAPRIHHKDTEIVA